MKQTEIKNEKKYVKVEDGFKDDADVVKLNIDESISGLLVEKKHSTLFGYVYKLKQEGDDRYKIICGTSVMNTKFANIDEGVEVMVERLKDKKNREGRSYQDYDVWYIP